MTYCRRSCRIPRKSSFRAVDLHLVVPLGQVEGKTTVRLRTLSPLQLHIGPPRHIVRVDLDSRQRRKMEVG